MFKKYYYRLTNDSDNDIYISANAPFKAEKICEFLDLEDYTATEITKEEYSENTEETKISGEFEEIKPCPFCGMDLSSDNYPQFMIARPVHSEEYLITKLNKGHFLGSDNYYNVQCIQCGATGRRGVTREKAIQYWNQRTDKVHKEYNGIL